METKNKKTEEIYNLMAQPSLYSIRNSVANAVKSNYADYDAKMLAINNGFVGSISDCFILYAIARLQFATRESIVNFLGTLSKREASYYIPELDYQALDNRLKALIKHGFILKIDNTVSLVDRPTDSHLILFSVTEDGRTLANNRLQKRVKPDRFGSTRPLCEKVGMGASAYVASRIMADDTFVDFTDGMFRGHYCGTVKLDSEFILKNDAGRENVAIISSFAHKNTGYMNDKAFDDYRYQKLNTMRDYIVIKTDSDSNRRASIICVCEDQKDFDDMATFLVASNGFSDEQLKNIYFTTQSVVAGVKDIKDSFIRIGINSDKDIVCSQGCDFL